MSGVLVLSIWWGTIFMISICFIHNFLWLKNLSSTIRIIQNLLKTQGKWIHSNFIKQLLQWGTLFLTSRHKNFSQCRFQKSTTAFGKNYITSQKICPIKMCWNKSEKTECLTFRWISRKNMIILTIGPICREKQAITKVWGRINLKFSTTKTWW